MTSPRRIPFSAPVRALDGARFLMVLVAFVALAAFGFATPARAWIPSPRRPITVEFRSGVPGQRPYLVSALSDDEWRTMPLREAAPGEYRITFPEPDLPSLPYRIFVEGARPGEWADHGVIRFDDYRADPLFTLAPGVPAWRTDPVRLADRDIILASPPEGIARRFASKPRVVAYFHDGPDYLRETPILALMANLSMRADMPLIYGVFVPPRDRVEEYGGHGLHEASDRYVDTLAGLIVPEAESRLTLSVPPSGRLIVGASLGGLISMHAVIRHPEVFTQAAIQSGSFWVEEGELTARLRRTPLPRLKLFVDLGSFEDLEMHQFNTQFIQASRDKGAFLAAEDVPGAHCYASWQERLHPMLEFFFGPSVR